MPVRARFSLVVKSAVLCVALLSAGAARAAPVALSDADLDAYAALRDARARSDVLGVSRDAGARERAEAAFNEAITNAGWSYERYTQVDSVVDEVLATLRQDAPAGSPAADAARKAATGLVDPPTLARIEKRRAGLESAASRAQAAAAKNQSEAARNQPAAAKSPPAPAKPPPATPR